MPILAKVAAQQKRQFCRCKTATGLLRDGRVCSVMLLKPPVDPEEDDEKRNGAQRRA